MKQIGPIPSQAAVTSVSILPPSPLFRLQKWVIVKYTDFIRQEKFWRHLKLDFGKARNG
jgi:hypothetical protein